MSLTPTTQQRKAIEAALGPVLVVAGPGAGKTACLIGRIGHLVSRLGMAAPRICAVTFTNKAAEEIAARLEEQLGARAEEVHRGTIHALCVEVLREHAAAAGLKPGFGIADDEYQRTVLRQMGQGRRSGQLLRLFGRRRVQGYRLQAGDEQLFLDYQAVLRRRNMLDFDDLVVRTRALFEERADVAGAVAARWDYLLVDEFQDVNAAQYDILQRLAAPHGNIFAVGDDEQSIYSWAGADPRILKRFATDHGIAAPIVLDRNHRSSQQIFEVARRLLRENSSLFDKSLQADRLSRFEVRAVGFPDDDAEAAWIMADIAADRSESGLGWGDYAVLYRRHDVGERLESRLVRSGTPCRLAKGRPLSDDRVIGYVIAALQLVVAPHDPTAAERFAGRVLPPHLMQRLEPEVRGQDADFLLALRDLASSLRGDPDAKKLWRFLYLVENLGGQKQKHATLRGLVEELLSQRVGPFRNPLEDRHEDLADPAEVPAAAELAERLAAARRLRSRVVLEEMNGLEIGLRGMLFAGGFKFARYAHEIEQAELDDLRIGPGDAGPEGLAYTLFKALQSVHAGDVDAALRDYVSFDLETTDKDVTTCDIVEIGAVRVTEGRPSAEFHTLVRPARPVSPGARRVHGHSDESLAAAPPFAEVWPKFRDFVGGATLVAHNGQRFDVPVLRRMAAAAGGDAERFQVFDTLPLARSLKGDSSRLGDLAARFGVTAGRAHHALDDARTLVGVYAALERLRVVRARKAALTHALAYLGLSFVLDGARRDTDEVKLLSAIGQTHALGRFSDCLEYYEAERLRTGARGPALDEVIERLGGRRRMEQLREEVDASRRYPEAVARLETLIDQDPDEPLERAIARFLERVALSTAQGAETEPHRVNLLTLHSTKGLEFSRVYIVGVEDEQMPGWVGPDDHPDEMVQEARRLLYVGMTRAKDRLVLTRVERRHGKPSGGGRFLEEMGLEAEQPRTVTPLPHA